MTKREILFEIRLAAKAMLRLEKKLGHHGVFAAIREWMNSPHRGKGIFWDDYLKRGKQ